MKIHQLANGARFEYEGEEYVKTGPLFASGKGGQRLIPKYAVLRPLGEANASVPENKEDFLSRMAVLSAFEAFFTDCHTLVAEDRRPEIEASRDRFLKAINGSS